jgi:diphthine-ammonia ligase
MKFVALISGGKDSCFNAIKCVSYGHELVCMGNLCPPEDFLGEEVPVLYTLYILGHVIFT